jgi:predicted nuclease of predicted toxin-antitoxin system
MAKFLAHENVPRDAIEEARRLGFDVQWVAETQPGASDDAVMQTALAEGRVVVTFDKDFGKLAFRRGRQSTPGVVLSRPRLRSPNDIAQFLVAVLGRAAQWEGHFCVAQEGKLRVVPLPD